MKHGATGHRHGKTSTAQLSPKTWPDFERLFSANGGVWGGCWCMFYHKPGHFEAKDYSGNRAAKRALTKEGRAHGTIVYCGGDPVAWCQFGPAEELARIDSKRGYRRTAERPWRITCLFVASGHRRSGMSRLAVRDSIRAIKRIRAKVIEAYPVEGERSATLLWSGTPGLYEGLGFAKVGPLGKGSWIYSLKLTGPS
jgi:hypothetical protein